MIPRHEQTQEEWEKDNLKYLNHMRARMQAKCLDTAYHYIPRSTSWYSEEIKGNEELVTFFIQEALKFSQLKEK